MGGPISSFPTPADTRIFAATASTRASRFRCGCCSRSELIPRSLEDDAAALEERAPRLTMSVYTPVTTEELDAWLMRYTIGSRIEMHPIAAGIENTNYFV